ncbi:hypothetical protein BO79DRAFT_144441, partial [Aspergillus costaricaensis CBS 115574]
AHTTTGCGKQGFPSAQPYLSHTPGANPFCCMFLYLLQIFGLVKFMASTALYSVMQIPTGLYKTLLQSLSSRLTCRGTVRAQIFIFQ